MGWVAGLVFAMIAFACGPDEMAQREEATSLELVAGLHLGMTKDSFFRHCQLANQQGLMRDGKDNFIRIDVDTNFLPPASVFEFYPEFDSTNRVDGLKGRIYSLAWSPWNMELSNDSLIGDASVYLQHLFGGKDFDSLDCKNKTYYKFDGNRRIHVVSDSLYPSEIKFFVRRFTKDTKKEDLLLDIKKRC